MANLRAAISADPELGNQGGGFEPLFHQHLAPVDWEWPWLLDWEAIFSEVGEIPTQWTEKSRFASKANRLFGRYDHRIFILSHTVAMAGYKHDKLEAAERHGWCLLSPWNLEPEPISAMLKQFAEGYASGEGPALLPPWFPGDMSGFIAALEPKYVKRTSGIHCRFRGVEYP